MRRKPVPDLVTYSEVVAALEAAGETARADAVFDMAVKDGLVAIYRRPSDKKLRVGILRRKKTAAAAARKQDQLGTTTEARRTIDTGSGD